MPKILKIFKFFIKYITIILIIFSFNITSNTNAQDLWKDTKIKTTEDIPWLDCECIAIKEWWTPDCQKPETRLYRCTVKWWFSWVYEMLQWFIKYALLVVSLLAIFMFVVAWIRLSISWIDSSQRDPAKKQISRIIYWLIVLLMSWWLLATLFPFIFK